MDQSANISYSLADRHTPISPTINIDKQDFTIDEQTKSYVKLHNPTLCILTPCYGGTTFVNYTICLINTLSVFQKLGFNIKVEFCKNDSLVTRARNNLIAKALTDKTITHLMFIDSDITWDPIDILKLVLSEKTLCGGIYPLKQYNWTKLTTGSTNPVQSMILRKQSSQLNNTFTDEQMIQYNLLQYNTNFLEATLKIEKNMTRVKHLATGFMMIHRSVVECMIKSYSSTKYTDDIGFLHGAENDFAYALFDTGVVNGHFYSEDWMFCDRWSKLGGSIWADVSINLTHIGVEEYNGSFIASVL